MVHEKPVPDFRLKHLSSHGGANAGEIVSMATELLELRQLLPTFVPAMRGMQRVAEHLLRRFITEPVATSGANAAMAVEASKMPRTPTTALDAGADYCAVCLSCSQKVRLGAQDSSGRWAFIAEAGRDAFGTWLRVHVAGIGGDHDVRILKSEDVPDHCSLVEFEPV